MIEDELFKNAMLEKFDGFKSAIQTNTEKIDRFPDFEEILQDVGKRTSAEEKRLEDLEGKIGLLDGSLKKLTEKLSLPIDAVSGLRNDLERHVDFFREPRHKEVHYRLFLGAPFLVLFTFWLAIVVLVVLFFQIRGQRDEYIENDIQWRYLKITPDGALQKVLDAATKLYQDNPEKFRKDVSNEEDRLRRLVEKMEQAEKTRKDIRELEGKKTMK